MSHESERDIAPPFHPPGASRCSAVRPCRRYATSLCSLLLAALQSGRAVVYLCEFIRVSIRVSLRIFVKFLDFLRKNEILPLTWTQLWICVDLVAVK